VSHVPPIIGRVIDAGWRDRVVRTKSVERQLSADSRVKRGAPVERGTSPVVCTDLRGKDFSNEGTRVMHAGSSDRANRHLALRLADVIAGPLVTFFAASLVLVPALVGQAQVQPTAGPIGSAEGVWREQIHWIPMVDAAGNQHLLQARICRPPGDVPARIVVIAHGTTPNNRNAKPGHCTAEAMRWFLDRGFIVVSALRRGYGATGGDWVEGIAHKPGDDYFRPGLETARDIAATVDYATALPYAQPRAAVVIGHSGGGWGTIAYNSIPHSRATALISMAGGRGISITNDGVRLTELGVWRPDLLIDAAGQFGRSATTPMLWVYSENDRSLTPTLAASLYDAFTRNGGKAELRQVAPYSDDGHRFFFGAGGSQIWGPLVERYLARQPAQ
jgi:dienelactone hydrolase